MSNDNKFVTKLIADNNFKVCAEIGVWNGALSFFALKNCPSIERYYMVDPLGECDNNFEYSGEDMPTMMSSGRYICNMSGKTRSQKDLDAMYESILSQTSEFPSAEFVRKKSSDASEFFEDKSLDFVFIDAIHLYENVKEDIELWLPKVRNGGILAGDDFNSKFPGVKRAVSERFPETLSVSSGIWWTPVVES